METTINLEELRRNQENKLKEVMAPICFNSKEELLANANHRLEAISKEYGLTIDRLFLAAESNELPFSITTEIINLISKVRFYNQA
jgi:hypothetical protein